MAAEDGRSEGRQLLDQGQPTFDTAVVQVHESGQDCLALFAIKRRVSHPDGIPKNIGNHREFLGKDRSPTKSVDGVHHAISSVGAKA
ncbi:hypothetical protein ASD02_03075 [Ensifer sp. Root1252]|nr:hypothetical protein ASD00_01435 [Ensifer sp. Root31]KQW63103.1 hypothetical protein ASD02_03075 [Ensifer sp. Root1252]KQY71120.1 hypothetical protein ASD52_05310 [Ensifer sp. Root142]KRC83924.1 hypothetical protein ASE32_03065 [Ensifer sp. Root231]KRD04277.1 hypothetical protein ASE47_01725 [Ensifer sp. Root258]OMQ45079.1 hypothetical protein BKP54_09145 [Ensifer sp. 1H6]